MGHRDGLVVVPCGTVGGTQEEDTDGDQGINFPDARYCD